MRTKFRETYLTIDPRALAAGRVALAAVLILDLARRLPFATLWYSNEGLLPNHTMLWRPTSRYVFSLFFTASLPYEAMIGFAVCGAAYLFLLVGLKTRFAQVASLVAVLSLHGRVLFIQNSGDVVLVELCVWTSFLPLGRRYSIDALRARLRQEPDATVSTILLRGSEASADRTPVVSWAVFAIVAQLAVIYLFNAVQKSGPTWRNGTAVHYVLYYANIATALGAWMRDWITPRTSQLLTGSTRFIEAILPLLLLTPVARRQARWLAVLLVAALHIGFSLCLNLGIFVPAMLVFIPFLVPASDWDRIERRWVTSRVAATATKLLARGLAGVERRGFLTPGTSPLDTRSRQTSATSYRARAREAAVLALMACATVGAVFDNAAMTHVPAAAEPRAIFALLGYLQMYQVWGMFAPDVPTTEQTVVINAVTVDGRHVDPLNEVLSPGHSLQNGTIPARLGNNSFAASYLLGIPDSPSYYPALTDWVLRYPDRTQRAADRIVSFQVFTVEQADPPPGQHHPGPPHSTPLFQYPTE